MQGDQRDLDGDNNIDGVDQRDLDSDDCIDGVKSASLWDRGDVPLTEKELDFCRKVPTPPTKT